MSTNKYEIFGVVIEATSPEEAVHTMMGSNFTSPETIQEFCKILADRVKIVYSLDIRSDTVDNFIHDMIENKIIISRNEQNRK